MAGQRQRRARLSRSRRRPRDARVGVPEGRARQALVPPGVRRRRRAARALQLHRHGAVPRAATDATPTTSAGRPAARRSKTSCAASRRSRVEGLPRFNGGAVGYMAYECARYYEKLPVPDADPQGFPEAIFMFVRHAARLRPPPAQDQGRQPRAARRRRRGLVPPGDVEDRGAGEAARAAALAPALRQYSLTPARRRPFDRRTTTQRCSSWRRSSARRSTSSRGDTYQIQVSQRFTRDDRRAPVRGLPRAARRSTRRRTCTTWRWATCTSSAPRRRC